MHLAVILIIRQIQIISLFVIGFIVAAVLIHANGEAGFLTVLQVLIVFIEGGVRCIDGERLSCVQIHLSVQRDWLRDQRGKSAFRPCICFLSPFPVIIGVADGIKELGKDGEQDYGKYGSKDQPDFPSELFLFAGCGGLLTLL